MPSSGTRADGARALGRGGARQGRSGARYSQRSDLQLGARLPVQTAPGQVYGVAKQQADAQRQIALPRALPAGTGAAPAAVATQGPTPDRAALPPLGAPTARPDEPVTTGSAFGPGAGPEVLGSGRDSTGDELRALYLRFPNDDLRRLIEALDR